MKVYLVFDVVEGKHFKEVFANKDDAYAYVVAEYRNIYHPDGLNYSWAFEVEEREVK
jgi:hypothetical protein